MIAQGLQISWNGCEEYVPLDFNAPHLIPKTLSTYWDWRGYATIDVAIARTTAELSSLNEISLILQYLRNDNMHLPDHREYWGTSKIKLVRGENEGVANWEGQFVSGADGDASWRKVANGLTKQIKRSPVSRIEREQQKLRTALLSIDQACALTGETNPVVLDAAHIIAAKRGGREVIENAILLRADLHRLLDAQLIHIDQSGYVHTKFSKQDTYSDLTIARQLPKKVLQRVQLALDLAAE